MATAVTPWPSTVNFTNFSDPGSDNLDTNFTEFAPEVGPPKRRRRMSLSSSTIQFSLYMTTAETQAFDSFYRDTLKDGTLPFTLPKPRTGTVEQYVFTGNAPTKKFADYGLWVVSMTLRNIPNTSASWLPLLTSGTVPNTTLSIVPDAFADFTTEGSSDPHYWYAGNKYGSFAAWLSAMSGTYTRTSAATWFNGSTLQTATTGVPRFTADGSGNIVGLRLTEFQSEQCLWNRDLTNAVWNVSNMSHAKSQTGIDGVANSATLLTATANNAITSQSITAASNPYMMGVWLKRITGTGTIKFSIDNGVTPITVVPTTNWQFFQLSAFQTLANPFPRIDIATSGDQIAVDFVSVRFAANIPDPIATTSAIVVKQGDQLSFPWTSKSFSTFVSVINQYKMLTTSFPRYVGSNGASADVSLYQNSNDTQFGTYDGSFALLQAIKPVPAAGPIITDLHKLMASGSASGRSMTSDAQTPLSDANPFDNSTITKLFIGSNAGTDSWANGEFKQFALWNNVVASSADLVRLTT